MKAMKNVHIHVIPYFGKNERKDFEKSITSVFAALNQNEKVKVSIANLPAFHQFQ